MSELRNLPAVDALLQTRASVELVARFGRPLTVDAMRTVLSEVREGYSSGAKLPDTSQLMSLITARLENWVKPSLISVINASGVVLHTNLGRAPLSKAALQAMQEVAASYSTLEFDLEKGGAVPAPSMPKPYLLA